MTQFQEELPERLGGRVVSAPQCHLGSGVEQRALGGEVAFVVVGVQQAGRRPAVDVGGQLPAEVDAVDHAGVEGHACGGEQVGGVAGQQDPPVAVSLDVSSVIGEARQPGRLSQGQIHAEHAADAVPELGQGHRLVVVVVGGLLLAGVDAPASAGSVDPVANTPRSVGVKPKGILPTPGDLEVAVLEHGHRLGHGGLGQPLDLRVGGAGERDVGQVAHPAARAVAAHEVAGGHPILPVRAAHVRGHRGVILAQPDHLVSAADLGAELAGELGEQRARAAVVGAAAAPSEDRPAA